MHLTTSEIPARVDDEAARTIELALEPGERWWGGAVADGVAMPYGRAPFSRDLSAPPLHGTDYGLPSGQAAPVLVSTAGRVIGSSRPFRFEVDALRIVVEGDGVEVMRGGSTLRAAHLAAARRFFPPSGSAPAVELFSAPQYNTWIEHPYRPTQESVLGYAHGLLEAGLPAGVIMIDDSWAPDYGTWRFDISRFPDPATMVAELHRLGFSVMLWVVPFVSPDSAAFRELEAQRLLVRDRSGRPAVRRWWNGFSSILDLSNPAATGWLTAQLDGLVTELGIDGFKFDGGDVRDFRNDDMTFAPYAPVEMCQEWARLGLRYPFNEYRACWRMGGQPLGQRLRDKPPMWGASGIGSLIPEMLAQSMLGHAFICPDMIGGGEIEAMSGQSTLDQEFFVRYTQLAAMSPMMQFSVAPARVLDAEHLGAVRAALDVRTELMPTILGLVKHAARTGEPIVRPMAYHAVGMDDITDQFFLGPDIVVAPVLEPGARGRAVRLPAGVWATPSGDQVVGPATTETPCELATIPRFTRVVENHCGFDDNSSPSDCVPTESSDRPATQQSQNRRLREESNDA